MPTPPPKPPRRDSSQSVRLAQILAGERAPIRESFPDEEPPTERKGIEFQVALLAKYYREMAGEDRVYLMRLAESFADRNRKP